MTEKENRQKEEKKMELLKDPKEQKSESIDKLIDKTLKNGNHVYLGTDWHLYVRNEKGKRECHKRKSFDEIIHNFNTVLSDDDVLIYLGDLCDGEMQDEKEDMKTLLKTIPGHKILVLGNNDTFPTSYYKSCGFEYVVQSFTWENILFTHIPCKNENSMNIHGHIHSDQYPPVYWIPYTNQIDVASCGGRQTPVELGVVISSQKKFSKKIKEDPSKFNEGYYRPIEGSHIFESVFLMKNCESTFYVCEEDPNPSE